MDKSCSNKIRRLIFVLPFLGLLIALGCGQDEKVLPAPIKNSTQTAHVNAEGGHSSDPSPEMRKVLEMEGYLDEGDTFKALVLARSLMDADDAEVRLRVLGVLDWIGKRALPELTEMLSDPVHSAAAAESWERACGELNYERLRVNQITNAITKLTETTMIDMILMHTVDMRVSLVLPALQGVIVNHRGTVAAACAENFFEHIAREPWSSCDRTKVLISECEKRED